MCIRDSRQTTAGPDVTNRHEMVAWNAGYDAVGGRCRVFQVDDRSAGDHRACDGSTAFSLDRDELWHVVDEPEGQQVAESLCDTGDNTAIPNRDDDLVWYFEAQLLGDFEGDGFLAFDHIRVESRVSVVPAEPFRRFHAQVERLVIIAINEEQMAPEYSQLCYFSCRRGCRRKDVHGDPGIRGEPRQA